jgi:flagellar motility protein MotE (MotC chaperone)
MIQDNARLSNPLAQALLLLALAFSLLFSFFLISDNASLRKSAGNLTASQQLLEANALSLQQSADALAAKEQDARRQLAAKNAELETAELRLGDANDRIAALSLQLAAQEQQLASARQDIAAQQAKVDEITQSLSTMEKNVNESMAWFRQNSLLPENHSFASSIFPKRVLSDCIDNGELNLACISYLMENTAFAIHYRTDAASNGKEDFLQSLNYTIDSGWGDCEDYSLLFKATLNTMRAKQPALVPVAMALGGDAGFRVYPKESAQLAPSEQFWYQPNAYGEPLGNLDNLTTYVICYTKDSSGGHCTVALSEASIQSSREIGKLWGARVFEPQIGMYLGKVGENFGICSQEGCEFQANAIRLVISDSDLYLYQPGKGWTGYSDYAQEVGAAKKEFGIS